MDNIVLYTFRRCPFAMRARLALMYSAQTVELREIVLKNKPACMLSYSPKGTVPVMVLPATTSEPQVIDESLDIMHWALGKNDPDHWIPEEPETRDAIFKLIEENDQGFKFNLDRYKYENRYPDDPYIKQYSRQQGEVFLARLEQLLQQGQYLFGEKMCLADVAIFPFIRQFAHVDFAWFEHTDFPKVQQWLETLKASKLFYKIMQKYPVWHEGDTVTFL